MSGKLVAVFLLPVHNGEAIFNQKLLEVVKQFWSPYPPKKLIYRISQGIQILWLWDISQKKKQTAKQYGNSNNGYLSYISQSTITMEKMEMKAISI